MDRRSTFPSPLTVPAPRQLRFYSSRFGGADTHVPFLAPWWGVPPEDPASINRGQFSAWAQATSLPYQPTPHPGDADFFVLCIPWKLVLVDPKAAAFARTQIDTARQLGTRIVIFFDSDRDDPIDWPEHAIVFRFSIYSDTRHRCEFAIPPFGHDLLTQFCGGQLQLRPWTSRPSVSFCGYTPPLGCKRSRQSLKEWGRYGLYRAGLLVRKRHRVAHAIRVHVLLTLRKAPEIACRFVLRDQFAFNRHGVLQPGGTAESARQQQQEFVDNLLGADYALCVRGIANCSIRLFESMSLGRIPLVINSQCVLPYDFVCDWRSFCAWIDENDIKHATQRLLDFHSQISPPEFVEKQRLARLAFIEWTCPEGFFCQMPRHWIPDWDPVLASGGTRSRV